LNVLFKKTKWDGKENHHVKK